MNTEKINFRQSRDFGETFNISVTFLRQNFKLFFQSLLFIAGPFILISAIAGAFYQANAITMFSVTRLGQSNGFAHILDQFGWAYVIFLLTTALAGLVVLDTVYSFMLVYMEKGPGGFTLNDVSRAVVKNIGNVLAVFFVYTISLLLILIVIVGIIVGISTAVPVLGILLIILLFFGMLFILPPLMWQLSAIYIVRMHEHRGLFDCYTRTRNVLRGNFWLTWVIMVCALIAVIIAGFVFALPQAIYQMVLMFSHLKGNNDEVSVAFLVVATVSHFFTTIIYSVMHIICGFHYFSLAEKNDGQGLMERINEIGATTVSNVEQQY